MLVRFTKLFDLANHQVAAIRRAFQVPCSNPCCQRLHLAHCVIIMTVLEDGAELVMTMQGARNTPEYAQQLLDHLSSNDVHEALAIMQGSHFRFLTPDEAHAREDALRQLILNRIPESV